jgi:predicted neuraminidase
VVQSSSTMLHSPRTRYLLEGTIAEMSSGSILQLFRSGSKFLWKTVSHDGGRSWAEPMATTIPNPNAKVNLLRLTNRTLALVFNDINDGSARKFLRCVSFFFLKT